MRARTGCWTTSRLRGGNRGQTKLVWRSTLACKDEAETQPRGLDSPVSPAIAVDGAVPLEALVRPQDLTRRQIRVDGGTVHGRARDAVHRQVVRGDGLMPFLLNLHDGGGVCARKKSLNRGWLGWLPQAKLVRWGRGRGKHGKSKQVVWATLRGRSGGDGRINRWGDGGGGGGWRGQERKPGPAAGSWARATGKPLPDRLLGPQVPWPSLSQLHLSRMGF